MIQPGKINPENLRSIKNQINKALKKSGRTKNDVQIVAVTKTFPATAIESALKNNIYCIGENRVQELITKVTPYLTKPKSAEFHFIGHLQKNKVRKAMQYSDVIETVDSLKLAEKISSISLEMEKSAHIYLQVNTGKDPSKYGFNKENLITAAEKITKMENINIDGIMTIPPNTTDEKLLTSIFNQTRKLRDIVKETINPSCKNLSMGMSNDFELAIKNGATHVRLGTILFGKRKN